LFVSGILYFSKNKEKISTKQKGHAVILGVSAGLLVIFFTLAVMNAKIADSIFVFYAGSIVSSFILGTFLYKEEVNFKKILMIAIAGIGLGIYVGFSIVVGFGIAMALLSGVFDGITNTIRKKIKGANKYEVMRIQFFSMSFTAAIIMVYFSSEQIIKEISVVPILVTLLFAVASIKLNKLLLYGFAHYDVNVGTIVLASEVFFTSAVGYIFFAEVLSVNEWVGGIMIFCASVIGGVDFTKLFGRFRLRGVKGMR
jgi:drug/metabolite transporter (DMT)-like permease